MAAKASSPAGCGSTSTISCPKKIFSFILDAVHWIAANGWKLLPDYHFDADSGRWRGTSICRPSTCPASTTSAMAAAASISRDDGAARRPACCPTIWSRLRPWSRAAVKRTARPGNGGEIRLAPDVESLRWFPLPSEIAAEAVRGEGLGTRTAPPFIRPSDPSRAGRLQSASKAAIFCLCRSRPADPASSPSWAPTNTGKTHLAMERMLGHESGYDRLPVAAAGAREL